MWQIWLIFSGIFFIAEIITVGFLIFWLAIGALFAMIVSFFTDKIIIQTTVFVISSTVLIFATKPFVKKFAKGKSNFKSNVYSIIGDTGIVTKKIDSIESTGQVKVNGELWSAVGKDDIDIEKGTEIKIVDIKGVKAIVSPVKISSKNS